MIEEIIFNGVKFTQIKDFENYYVSQCGKVLSTKCNKLKVLKNHINTKGYLYQSLRTTKKPKLMTLHRLVALAFISNPDNKLQIDHINGIKVDNRVENLRWVTCQENCKAAHDNNQVNVVQGERQHLSKLTSKQVLEIRELYSQGIKRLKLAELFKVHGTNIDCIIKRKTWRHI